MKQTMRERERKRAPIKPCMIFGVLHINHETCLLNTQKLELPKRGKEKESEREKNQQNIFIHISHKKHPFGV